MMSLSVHTMTIQIPVCLVLYYLYTVSLKMHRHLVTIIWSNLHCWKVCLISNKAVHSITHHTLEYVATLPWETSAFKFVAFFCVSLSKCVPMIGSYQTHGGNFITFQLIIRILRTILWVCSRTRSLTRLTFSSVWAVCGLTLWAIDCADVSFNFFNSLLMLLLVHHFFANSFINSVTLYSFNLYTFLIEIFVAENHV